MSRKPHLILSSLDVDRLEALLAQMSAAAFPGKADLEAEIARADIVDPTDKTVDALMKLDLPAGVDVEIKLQ